MKVYVNGFDYKINDMNYDIEYKNNYIYTNDGIYIYNEKQLRERENKKEKEYEIKKIEYKEETYEKNYKGYTFLIDKTTLDYKESIYHIPYFHLFCEETIYKKNMDDFFFVKIKYFDQTDYYFEIDNMNDNIFDKMITFLSSK